jgi:hypothetical protein
MGREGRERGRERGEEEREENSDCRGTEMHDGEMAFPSKAIRKLCMKQDLASAGPSHWNMQSGARESYEVYC